MQQPVVVLFNPSANRWAASRRRAELEAALREAGIPYELQVSQAKGHLRRLAAKAAREHPHRPIFIAGGDGSVGESVNGIADALGGAPRWTPIGVFPLGGGNDFVANLGLPTDLFELARIYAQGRTRLMDVLDVDGMYFVNNAALGLEPYVTRIEKRINLRGPWRYAWAALRGILDNPRWHVRMHWEGGSYQGPVNLVTVGNWPRTGGFFYLTPQANGFDGQLTFTLAALPSRWALIRALFRALKPDNTWPSQPPIWQAHSTWLEVACYPPAPLHADGEIITDEARECRFNTHPRKLPVFGRWE
ncbi:MAG: hypothetical protein GXO36_01965 [Chloroflexi bacterium]|nr:hypothetical protein [Chloroflexota bacterium]